MDPRQPKVLSAAPARQPWWAFPISAHREAAGVKIRIAWGRLALQLLTLAVAAWLAMGSGMFLWIKYYRGFAEARLVDILLPNRWAGYRTARGNFYIKQAMQELADQKAITAQHKARTMGIAANALVLSADTVVAVGRRILPKAETMEEASECLRTLSGRSHRVFTAVTMLSPSMAVTALAVPGVHSWPATMRVPGQAGSNVFLTHRGMPCSTTGRMVNPWREGTSKAA